MLSNEYLSRYTRNIGILTQEEQQILQKSTVAIAGVGGLGGSTLINLVRMGIGKFIIADLDKFDFSNTNRQMGAMSSTMGKNKTDVMEAMAKDINPEVEIIKLQNGVQKENVDELVQHADLVVDSLDFFCLTARDLLYESCKKFKKTVVLSAPLGFSATLHVFTADSMQARDFFDWKEKMDPFDKMIHFVAGMTPSALHLKYLQFDKEKLVKLGTGPSISFSCGLGAALNANEVLMALLNKRNLYAAPYYCQFDLYRGKYVRKKLTWGNRGLFQRFKIYLAKKKFNDIKEQLTPHIK